jgi:hypothetical protein
VTGIAEVGQPLTHLRRHDPALSYVEMEDSEKRCKYIRKRAKTKGVRLDRDSGGDDPPGQQRHAGFAEEGRPKGIAAQHVAGEDLEGCLHGLLRERAGDSSRGTGSCSANWSRTEGGGGIGYGTL